jgi:hypothetical protein
MCPVDGRNVLQAENVIERAEQAPAKKIFWMFRYQSAQAQVDAIATSPARPLTSRRDRATKTNQLIVGPEFTTSKVLRDTYGERFLW